MILEEFIRGLPKAELHLHLEGSLEPEMLMRLAQQNKVDLPFDSIEEVRKAYQFTQLQDFLDIYYAGMGVLQTEQDFYDLTTAYLQRCKEDGVVHVEVFFDPQGHTERGLPFQVAADGIVGALKEGHSKFGISSHLIMCFLRHLSEEDAYQTYAQAEPYFADQRMIGIGLDSSEQGYPPSKFKNIFETARNDGLKTVAHAGEEGPPAYVREAIELLQIDRIDHGNRALEDQELVADIKRRGLALTVCPLSNLRLCVVDDLKNHPLKKMLDQGLCATVNSDDPAYFGGYLLANFIAISNALNLTRTDVVQLTNNSIIGSFLDADQKQYYLNETKNHLKKSYT